MKTLLKKFWQEESGQALVEYGVVIGVVVVAAIAILVLFRDKLDSLFGRISGEMDKAPASFSADGK